MFVIDATGDFAQALPRLARLMYNIERGARVYEWTQDSTADANPKPRPNFLSITIPGITAAAPPAVVNYRPSVAVVYCTSEVNLAELVSKLQDLLASFPDDHLRGYLPVEAAPHATLLHCNRTYTGIALKDKIPTRYFYVTSKYGSGSVPSHISLHGAFTWYFLPIAVAIRINRFSTFEEFNAVVAGVFLDTILGGKEIAKPVYATISSDFFNAPPAPADICKALVQTDVILVYRSNRFYLAGEIYDCLSMWKSPAADAPHLPLLDELRLANVAPGPIGDGLCGLCCLPLWGEIYAVRDTLIAPYRMATCVWCAGCLPLPYRAEAIRSNYPRTMAEAYRGTVYADLLPLLEAEVKVIMTGPPSNPRPYFRVHPSGAKKGDGYFIEVWWEAASNTSTPPCLRVPELRKHRVSSIRHKRVFRALSG